MFHGKDISRSHELVSKKGTPLASTSKEYIRCIVEENRGQEKLKVRYVEYDQAKKKAQKLNAKKATESMPTKGVEAALGKKQFQSASRKGARTFCATKKGKKQLHTVTSWVLRERIDRQV